MKHHILTIFDLSHSNMKRSQLHPSSLDGGRALSALGVRDAGRDLSAWNWESEAKK
jgi:hypothetical protein